MNLSLGMVIAIDITIIVANICYYNQKKDR